MISGWLSTALARRNIHYGWAMIAVTFVTALVSAAAVGAPGVFIVPLQKEFGWSTAEISSAMSIRFVLFGLMAPFAAALMNRYGLRNVTLIALARRCCKPHLVARDDAGLAADGALGRRRWYWHWHDGAGARRHRRSALVQRTPRPRRGYPHRERGHRPTDLPADPRQHHRAQQLALGTGADVRDAGHSPRSGVLLVMRDRPSDIGIRPYGDTSTEPLAGAATEHLADHGGSARCPARCCPDQVFWILFATFFICGASTNGLVQVHLIPMCLDFGIPQIQAAGLLAAMGVFDFVGTIASGWLSDRYDNRYLLFWYYGLRGLLAAGVAVHRLLVLRSVAVRAVLRPGLDRHRAADRAAYRVEVRA